MRKQQKKWIAVEKFIIIHYNEGVESEGFNLENILEVHKAKWKRKERF